MIQVLLTLSVLLYRNKIIVSQLVIIFLAILSPKKLYKKFQAMLEKMSWHSRVHLFPADTHDIEEVTHGRVAQNMTAL